MSPEHDLQFDSQATFTGASDRSAPGQEGPNALIADGQHLDRVVVQGIAEARQSICIATADLKAMLIPLKRLDSHRQLKTQCRRMLESGAHTGGSTAGGKSSRWGRGRDQAVDIITLLASQAARGVEVRVLHAGVPSGAALHAMRRIGDVPGLMFRRCPRLHMKLIVVDAAGMYVGSANLTGAGLGAKSDHRRNFELGLWISDPDAVDQAMDRFNAIWEGHHCPACGRRDVCPAPLESPDLS